MKIHPSNKYSPNFCAHLTKKFYKDMIKADIKETEKELADYGIQADFQDSKEVAACTLQAAKIFKALNAGLPKKVITINTSPKAEENPLGMAATNGTISFNKTLFN